MMKKFLHISFTVLLAAAALLSCTKENHGDNVTIIYSRLSIAAVPDYTDGSVDLGKGSVTFNVRPAEAVDSLVNMNDCSIYEFDVVPTEPNLSSPSLEVTKASNVDGKLQLEVSCKGFAINSDFSAILKIKTGTYVNTSNHFNVNPDKNAMVEEMLKSAYYALPTCEMSLSEVATDDAVTNVASGLGDIGIYRKMAAGEWTANLDGPENIWEQCVDVILDMNNILKYLDPTVDTNLAKIGEAYAFRAIMMYYMLRNHAGPVYGVLTGVPIYNNFLSENDEWFTETPRASFQKCIDSFSADIEKALEFNEKALSSGVELRIKNQAVKAYRVRLALMASSPAFFPDRSGETAEYAGNLLQEIGGPDNLDKQGHKWFMKDQIEGITSSGEDIMHISFTPGNDWEMNNYPPTQHGSGQVNPTQNFIDAIPMDNGYPCSDGRSGYTKNTPYAGRDPRLDLFVVRDTSKVDGNLIHILSGNTDDGTGKTAKSTRTGYYLRKPMRDGVNYSVVGEHILFHVRYTEIFLACAESSNEAFGPKDDPKGFGFSAYDIIKAIRNRAGIAAGGSDDYLNECTQSKEMMRELIHNERRIELCFEGSRFWDLRRWNETEKMKETAKGGRYDASGNLESFNVESRNFEDYMIYGPVPKSVLDKCPAITQNDGWGK